MYIVPKLVSRVPYVHVFVCVFYLSILSASIMRKKFQSDFFFGLKEKSFANCYVEYSVMKCVSYSQESIIMGVDVSRRTLSRWSCLRSLTPLLWLIFRQTSEWVVFEWLEQ